MIAGVIGVSTLTALGWRDRPAQGGGADAWTLREIGGRVLAQNAGCARCHGPEAIGGSSENTASSRGAEWIAGHIEDPEMIAPGPASAAGRPETRSPALVAYVHRLSRQPYPGFPQSTEAAASVFARFCIGCHTIDGEGGKDSTDLSRIGEKRDAAYLQRLIADPESVNPKAEMPSFETRLSAAELEAVATYLASRK